MDGYKVEVNQSEYLWCINIQWILVQAVSMHVQSREYTCMLVCSTFMHGSTYVYVNTYIHYVMTGIVCRTMMSACKIAGRKGGELQKTT